SSVSGTRRSKSGISCYTATTFRLRLACRPATWSSTTTLKSFMLATDFLVLATWPECTWPPPIFGTIWDRQRKQLAT
ncbi:hypothetical protein GGI16_008777, partial [Coemansia sp. S142-1]